MIPRVRLEADLEAIVNGIEANAAQTYDILLGLHQLPVENRVARVMEYFEINAAQAIAICHQYGVPVQVSGKKPDTFWKYNINIAAELLEVSGGKAIMPSRTEMYAKNKKTLATVISQRFGSYKTCAEVFGLDFVNSNEGSFREWSEVVAEVNAIYKKHPSLQNKFPGAWWLRNNGYSCLVSAIVSSHGGMAAARKKLGAKPVVEQTPMDMSLTYIQSELEKIWEKYPSTKNTVPPENWLRKHKYFRLNHSISGFGGCPKLRDALGFEQVHKHEINEYDTPQK
ncbi:MAG TPA: hypothetical protein VK158_00675, partial [Acidobacteriota bacterium]|nr:hypothetical protein [Acidobacteriota bacterium]